MRRLKRGLIVGIIISLLGGCKLFPSLSPEQIVEKALAATEELQISYYGEMTLKGVGSVGESLVENVTMKEWYDGKRNRSEITSDEDDVIIVSDGEKVQLYLVDEAIVYETVGEDIEAFAVNPKEQLNNLLTILRDTHKVEMLGKEKVAERQTHHLRATKREDSNSLLGDLDLWIDEEYWIPLKTKSKSGQVEIEMEYNLIEFNQTFSDDIFVLDLPEDVVIESIDDPIEPNVIDKDEIATVFEQAVYIIEETDHWKIESISYIEEDKADSHLLMEIDYMYNDVPGLSLVMMKDGETNDELEELEDELSDLLGDMGEKVSIRDTEAMVIDSTEIRMISWREENIQYSVHLLNPTLEIDQILDLIKSMTEVK